MRYYQRAGDPGRGLFPEKQTGIPMMNRAGALTKGAIVMVDEAMTDGDSTNMTVGDDASGFRNVIAPAAAFLGVNTFMVAEKDVAADTEGLFTLVGIVPCDIVDGAVAQTEILTATAGSTELTNYASTVGTVLGQKVIARPLEARGASPGTALVSCFFNGYGFSVGTHT